jgi:hypothetical protein
MILQHRTVVIALFGLCILLLASGGKALGSAVVSPESPNSLPSSASNVKSIDQFEEYVLSAGRTDKRSALAISLPAGRTTSQLLRRITPVAARGRFIRLLDWQKLPVIPELSERALQILVDGIARGNMPNAFSTIGDCQSMPPVFMGFYDEPGAYLLLEEDRYLEQSIRHFSGSFSRQSISVDNGFSVASVMSPMWTNLELCNSTETPLECEFRLQNPAVVFVNLGTNWHTGDDVKYEDYLREIVDFSIAHGVLPILSTKADNVEGDHSINEGVAMIADEYELPLWNFWRTAQVLPEQGLDTERGGGYLSVGGWNVHSYSGLRMLHVIYTELLNLQVTSP